ncbi:MAG: sn-glycerol-3-phosphate ABC transporter ATP-binding protein UgpC [Pseudomonadota bacterium]
MAGLTLRGVKKIYAGGVTAVHGADIDIADGEFIVLVGPSGCGKSTILRMVAGLEAISDGEVSIDGQVVNKKEPGERDIAMVFQNYALYPHMSVRQNMSYGLKNVGMSKADIADRIDEASKILQLDEYLDRKPRQLSGGQRQRVAMGRALVREPKAFLLDEPLSNLDAKLRGHMRSELKELHQRLGATFIYVTHDQVEAMSLADRIVVMNAGRIEQIGSPREIYDRPATRFVAEFIGAPQMNFIPGSVLGKAAPWVGIRPEAITVDGTGDVTMQGTVKLVEDLGADRFAHVMLGGAGEDMVVARAANNADHQPGAAATLTASASALAFFDADGRRME